MLPYDHKKIEIKWQEYWRKHELFKTQDNAEMKYYILDMFPYPSGAGLHVGHPKGYIATDIISRFKRMQGYEVLHPMGWDAFGLPAENYALKHKVHPSQAVMENIATFKKQLAIIGFDYDWSREINTTEPEYYRWTQWVFLQLYKKGLAYESYEPINWCPSCKTGLANEDLEQGTCERCGSEVEQRPMRQWVLKITDYADRLLEKLDDLDWEDSIKDMQRNWIGRSEGARIKFEILSTKSETNSNTKIQNSKEHIEVFTTRPDTIFGATYMVLSPEHSLVRKLEARISNFEEVQEYVEKAKKKTELERTDLAKEKTGVSLKGISAINPASGEEIPVWVADYVLAGYGTGAIMAVPGHDDRDYEFAKKYNLSTKQVVAQQFGDRKPNSLKRLGVSAYIEDGEGNILLQSHTHERGILYSLPGGGVDEGERVVDALKRELIEETGYADLEVGDCIGAFEYNFYSPEWDKDRCLTNPVYRVQLLSSKRQEPALTEDEKAKSVSDEWVNQSDALKRLRDSTDFCGWGESIILENYFNNTKVFTGEGVVVNSGEYDGLTTAEMKDRMINWFEKEGHGKRSVTYRLKDWVFSRQRYWGEPIPIIHCEVCGVVPVPEGQLPVVLPEVERYEPTDTGESPLANIDEWVNVDCPQCGGNARRETNTMPQWAGSCWYYLRYIDNQNPDMLVDKTLEKKWSPVDLYVGGAEHATRHLIYARFWHKFLYDIGVVNYDEPFNRLQHVGLILAEDGRKMSKRWGNVVNPDDIVEQLGADALRLYEMFMGPFSQSVSWDTDSMIGVRKFLERVWKLQYKIEEMYEDSSDTIRLLHQTIKKVTGDIEKIRFNTAISQMMILANHLFKESNVSQGLFEQFILLLSPFAPHIAEESWLRLGHKDSLTRAPWPQYIEQLARDDEIELVIQVNGKVRDKFMVPADISEEDAKITALASEKIQHYLNNVEPKKVIVVKGRLVNIVV